MTLTCDFCGRRAEDAEDAEGAEGAETLTWSTSVENGRQRRYCDVCSRRNLRSMEGKLDSEFW
ncbi:hypothetical protein [Nocardioides marinquilinus]|uniref:hypothetical protein n=1 Tax=Nocardioides marinquilinus TaxID=1210400 RepID=UPI0031EE5221